MAAKIGEEKKQELFNDIIEDISIKGMSLIDACKNRMHMSIFYKMINNDEILLDRYARACKERQEYIFEEIIKIADDSSFDIRYTEDGIPIENKEYVSRCRLKIDARKWILSKMNPKKYGDKLDLTTDDKPLTQQPILNISLEGKMIDLS